MAVWQTVLVFAGIPVGAFGLLALLVIGPGAARAPRYRPGRPWEFEPVWYIARPDVAAPAASAEGRAALAAAERVTMRPAAAAGSEPEPAAGTARGGASGRW